MSITSMILIMKRGMTSVWRNEQILRGWPAESIWRRRALHTWGIAQGTGR
jgi:hypothetical protein